MALPVGPLATPVSLTSAVAPLITPVGLASVLTPNTIEASGTTIPLPTVTTDADRKDCAALGRTANPTASEDFILHRPAHSGIMPDRMIGRMTRAFGADDVAEETG